PHRSTTALTTTAKTTTTAVHRTGFVKVCKQADGSGVSGSFSFTVAGRSVSVAVGHCSAPIELPTGSVSVSEQASAGVTVSAITCSPSNRLLSVDLAARLATVLVVSGETSTVTFVNHALHETT